MYILDNVESSTYIIEIYIVSLSASFTSYHMCEARLCRIGVCFTAFQVKYENLWSSTSNSSPRGHARRNRSLERRGGEKGHKEKSDGRWLWRYVIIDRH